MSTFQKDLHESQALENKFKELLESQDIVVTTTQDKGKFDAFDIMAVRGNVVVTFEIKYDRMVKRTGNVAVEMHKVVKGVKQNSGLSATKADFYAYYFDGDNDFYVIHPPRLEKLIADEKHKKIVHGGDGYRSVLALFDRNVFKEECIVFNESYFND